MLPRDEKILKHVALYRLSIRAVIEHLFFDGKSSDDVIARLVNEEKCLQVAKLPNRISYYYLSVTAARKRGVKESRAQGGQARSLRRSLAVLWFCCMTPTNRHRIERNTLTKLFGRHNGLGIPHCWEPIGEKGRLIHRIYTPGPNTPDDDVVRTLRKDAESTIAHPQLAPLVLAHLYVFAVLVEHPQRLEKIRETLDRAAPLPVSVKIELTPDVQDLAAAVREHKRKRGILDAELRQLETEDRA